MRGGNASAVVAIAAVGLTTLASAPVASAKEPKNFDNDNIQVITSTSGSRGCGNSVEASRYNAKGKLLGSRTLIKPTPGIYVIPKDYDRLRGDARNFLFKTYDCDSSQQRIYEWTLSNKNSSPELMYSSSPGEMIGDVAYDRASDNIVFIRSSEGNTDSVDMLLRSGGITRIWEQSGDTGFRPVELRTDTGGDLGIVGMTFGGAISWTEILVNTRRPMEQGYINKIGPGAIRSADVGGIDISLNEASIYVASESQAWLCNWPGNSRDVRSDTSCVAFRPVDAGIVGPDVYISSGKAKGSDRMNAFRLLYWNGGLGRNYVQPVSADPTGLPQVGPLMRLKKGPAARARDLVPANDLEHAIDAFEVKTWRAG